MPAPRGHDAPGSLPSTCAPDSPGHRAARRAGSQPGLSEDFVRRGGDLRKARTVDPAPERITDDADRSLSRGIRPPCRPTALKFWHSSLSCWSRRRPRASSLVEAGRAAGRGYQNRAAGGADAEMADHLAMRKVERLPPAGNHRNGACAEDGADRGRPDRAGDTAGPQRQVRRADRCRSTPGRGVRRGHRASAVCPGRLTTGEIRAHLGEIYGVERVPRPDLAGDRLGGRGAGGLAVAAAGPDLPAVAADRRDLREAIRDGRWPTGRCMWRWASTATASGTCWACGRHRRRGRQGVDGHPGRQLAQPRRSKHCCIVQRPATGLKGLPRGDRREIWPQATVQRRAIVAPGARQPAVCLQEVLGPGHPARTCARSYRSHPGRGRAAVRRVRAGLGREVPRRSSGCGATRGSSSSPVPWRSRRRIRNDHLSHDQCDRSLNSRFRQACAGWYAATSPRPELRAQGPVPGHPESPRRTGLNVTGGTPSLEGSHQRPDHVLPATGSPSADGQPSQPAHESPPHSTDLPDSPSQPLCCSAV